LHDSGFEGGLRVCMETTVDQLQRAACSSLTAWRGASRAWADTFPPRDLRGIRKESRRQGPVTNIKNVRTIALVGQAGSGKTTLAEALLAKAGAITSAGSVERGSTVCDYSPLEKQMQHSLKLSVASFEAKNGGEPTRIHLLDTPGYPEFLGHSLPALAAVETAAIVINAQNGV